MSIALRKKMWSDAKIAVTKSKPPASERPVARKITRPATTSGANASSGIHGPGFRISNSTTPSGMPVIAIAAWIGMSDHSRKCSPRSFGRSRCTYATEAIDTRSGMLTRASHGIVFSGFVSAFGPGRPRKLYRGTASEKTRTREARLVATSNIAIVRSRASITTDPNISVKTRRMWMPKPMGWYGRWAAVGPAGIAMKTSATMTAPRYPRRSVHRVVLPVAVAGAVAVSMVPSRARRRREHGLLLHRPPGHDEQVRRRCRLPDDDRDRQADEPGGLQQGVPQAEGDGRSDRGRHDQRDDLLAHAEARPEDIVQEHGDRGQGQDAKRVRALVRERRVLEEAQQDVGEDPHRDDAGEQEHD